MFKGIKNIFFDFDGVILDSVGCKSVAFEKLYMKYGKEVSNKVKEFHINNGGISRFEKFRYWHKEYLEIELDQNGINQLADDFSEIVFENVINSPKIQGINEFIKQNHNKYNCWIITGTPTEEIIRILKKINFLKYFKGFYGSPKKKTYWTEKIIKENKLNRNQTLFLGDTITDYEAAKFSKINFALRKAFYNTNAFKKINIFKFDSFDQLNQKLNE